MRVHIDDNNRVIGKSVDTGDGVELAFADTFSTGNQLLFSIPCVARKAKLISKPEGVVRVNCDWAGLYAFNWKFGKHSATLVDLGQDGPIGCVPKGAIGCCGDVSDGL